MKLVSEDIYYVGVNDHSIDLFESQYIVPNGMAYNSYLILDDKIAIMDSVDLNFKDEWINNIKEVLKDKKPTYLIIHHMEPDHSANIISLVKEYPDIILVGNAKTFVMLDQFFRGFEYQKLVVKENDVLDLGHHQLQFVMAPMVHWPEVMVSYDKDSKTLFSADAFGKFGALDVNEDWACEARRYYFGIVGKYGMQVQMLLKKLAPLPIERICALHGPILDSNIDYYLNLYQIWSSYSVEANGVFIAYSSVYGNTKKAVMLLKEELEKNHIKVAISDLTRDDIAEAVEDAFKYGKLVIASTTYNAGVFPCVESFISALKERNYQKRKIAIIENGTWAPNVIKTITAEFETSKDISFVEPFISIKSSLDEKNIDDIKELAKALLD